MSARSGSLAAAIACALLGSSVAGAAASAATATPYATGFAAAAPPTTPPEQGEGVGTVAMELIDGLGNGGQPEGLPREIVVAGERFLFDRMVPLRRQDLVRVAQQAETIAYARAAEGPHPALYVSTPDRSEDVLARFLPEHIATPTAACPAESGSVARADVAGSPYLFAGIETDLTTDALTAVGESEGQPVYADAGASAPYPELFFASGGDLLRFVVASADGRPTALAESLAFNGVAFPYLSDATDVVDPATLTKVGCSTAFPVLAPAGTGVDGATQLYVQAGGRLFLFGAEGAAPPEPPATTTLPPTTTTTLPPPTTTTTLPPTTTTTTTTTTLPTTTTTTTLPPTTTTTTLPATSTTTTTTEPATTSTTTSTTEPATTSTTTTTTTEPATTSTTPTTAPPDGTTSTTSAPATTTTTTEPETPTTTTTLGIEPPAVVLTLPPSAPPPAASITATASCSVTASVTLDEDELAEHVPTRIQVGGVAYLLVSVEDANAVGTLAFVGCVGQLELVRTESAGDDDDDDVDVVYLRFPGAVDQLYRFEAALTFEIQSQPTDQPQTITALDQRYRLAAVWLPSVYSSTSVVLFAADPADPSPDTLFGLNVSRTVVGDSIGEYRAASDDTAQPSTEIVDAAAVAGLHPDLVLDGRRYVLVEVNTPVGTTRNGFMTLFGPVGDASSTRLLGRDKRDIELYLFERETPPPAEG